MVAVPDLRTGTDLPNRDTDGYGVLPAYVDATFDMPFTGGGGSGIPPAAASPLLPIARPALAAPTESWTTRGTFALRQAMPNPLDVEIRAAPPPAGPPSARDTEKALGDLRKRVLRNAAANASWSLTAYNPGSPLAEAPEAWWDAGAHAHTWATQGSAAAVESAGLVGRLWLSFWGLFY